MICARRVSLLAFVAWSLALVPAAAAEADRQFAALGSYEQKALDRALAARSLEIEANPDGKVVGTIFVSPMPVFPPSAGILQSLNVLHRTTRAEIIARELLIAEGDRYSDALIRESERNIRDPFVINLVVIRPVRAQAVGRVDLLVVTSDVWSLRTNSEFELQEDELTFLTLSLAENNLLGWRKQAALIFEMDQGEYSLGPRYRDLNVLGTRLDLIVRPRLIFSRADSEFEGTQSETSLSYPLWSLARRWGGAVSLTHKRNVNREFTGSDLDTYDNPESPEVEELPRIYDNSQARLAIEATRSIGENLRHHFTLGHELAQNRANVVDDFEADPEDRAAFVRDILPRSERIVAAFARYRIFAPNFLTVRNVDSFDLPEYVQIGPDSTVELAFGSASLGSTESFLRYRVDLGWIVDFGDAFARIRTGISGRATSDGIVDSRRDFSAFVTSPPIRKLGRLVAGGAVTVQSNVEDNERFVVGGESGLRGYEVGEFRGTSFFRGNLEFRGSPVPVAFVRLGVLAFFDIGHASDDFEALSARADFGIGLRMVAPQLAQDLYRIDWAFATRGPSRGFPGRLSIGFRHVF